jgi:hypothetical protein
MSLNVKVEGPAPEVVAYESYVVGNTYVRSTKSLPGLVHIGSSDEARADKKFLEAVNYLLQTLYDGGKEYRHLDAGRLLLTDMN